MLNLRGETNYAETELKGYVKTLAALPVGYSEIKIKDNGAVVGVFVSGATLPKPVASSKKGLKDAN